MAFTALERMLVTERVRQRAALTTGYAIPSLTEIPLDPSACPLLVTNMKGAFMQTRLSQTGYARYGFSHVPVGTDDVLLCALHRTIDSTGWANRAESVRAAFDVLAKFGLVPHTIVVGPSRIQEVAPDLTVADAQKAMQAKSEVCRINNTVVLLADLPDGAALVATLPSLVGCYTRVGDYVGVLIQQAQQSVVVVS
jgi:hypothetical protein